MVKARPIQWSKKLGGDAEKPREEGLGGAVRKVSRARNRAGRYLKISVYSITNHSGLVESSR